MCVCVYLCWAETDTEEKGNTLSDLKEYREGQKAAAVTGYQPSTLPIDKGNILGKDDVRVRNEKGIDNTVDSRNIKLQMSDKTMDRKRPTENGRLIHVPICPTLLLPVALTGKGRDH